jgi:hypothetical protein
MLWRSEPSTHHHSLFPSQSIAKQRDQIVKELQALQDKKDDSETKKVRLTGHLFAGRADKFVSGRIAPSIIRQAAEGTAVQDPVTGE